MAKPERTTPPWSRSPARRALMLLLLFAAVQPLQAGEKLLDAAQAQDWTAVEKLVRTGNVDIDLARADGSTALAWAAYWDHLVTAKQLLAAGADADAANEYGVTPLFLAAQNRSPAMVNVLLKAGADPEAATWSGVTPLMAAARTGETEVLAALLRAGADVNVTEPRRGQTALMWAISFGHSDAARQLIEHGADVNARTHRLDEAFVTMELEAYGDVVEGTPQGGYTPLMFAARAGDEATARLLLQHGAEIDAAADADGTPLVMAAAAGHEEMALALLEAGADPNVQDASGMTALHYAMRDGLKILHGYTIAEGTQVCNFGGDETRCKPLDVLTEKEQELLANPTGDLYTVEPEPDPEEPLPGSSMHELARQLLAAGADPNLRMKHPPPHLRLARLSLLNLTGATPFFLAAAAQDLQAVEMMLEHEGVEPLVTTSVNELRFKDQQQRHADDNQVLGNATSLMVAVGMGRKSDFSPAEEQDALQIADKLIRLGADVNATTATGWTPLHAASFIGAESIIRFLVKHGARVNVANGCGQSPISLALGNNLEGLLDRTVPQVSSAELLLELGAGDQPLSGSFGDCVLGRGGLAADAAQNEFVRQRVAAVEKRLEQKESSR